MEGQYPGNPWCPMQLCWDPLTQTQPQNLWRAVWVSRESWEGALSAWGAWFCQRIPGVYRTRPCKSWKNTLPFVPQHQWAGQGAMCFFAMEQISSATIYYGTDDLLHSAMANSSLKPPIIGSNNLFWSCLHPKPVTLPHFCTVTFTEQVWIAEHTSWQWSQEWFRGYVDKPLLCIRITSLTVTHIKS